MGSWGRERMRTERGEKRGEMMRERGRWGGEVEEGEREQREGERQHRKRSVRSQRQCG